MFELNEYVVKANHGVCQIKDIVHLDMPSIDKKKKYYYLVPVDDAEMKVYVPVDMADSLRYAMSKEEALDCIGQLKNIESAWIKNERQREMFYKEVIKSCDPIQLVSIIKNMYERKQDRMASGKMPTAIDEKYFKIAEEQLFSELSFALGIDKSKMLAFIQNEIEG